MGIDTSYLHASMGSDIVGYLRDPDVIEVMLNPDGKIFVDTLSKGKYNSGKTMNPIDAHKIISIVADYMSLPLDRKNPILSGSIPETGERFQGQIPPIVKNPSFAIRKKATKIFTLEEYVSKETMTQNQMDKIIIAIKERRNILVVGGTSTGKTTLVNAIIKKMVEIDPLARFIILEDVEELQCAADDKKPMLTSEWVNMQGLVKDTMRERPDRIIVGEIRDHTALDLLKAWNSGHPGGICTIHADGAYEGLRKLEQFILEVAQNPLKDLIGGAVDLVIVIKKHGNKRYIDEIQEVKKYNNLEDRYILEAI